MMRAPNFLMTQDERSAVVGHVTGLLALRNRTENQCHVIDVLTRLLEETAPPRNDP